MKRIKNADINFKLNPKRINLNNFSMKFYTVNSEAYFFTKDQNNLVSVERDATIYDEDVIISGGTKVLDYYLPLDWSELVQLGEGVLNYRCINNIEDPYFPDMAYNQVIEDTTGYYIDSDIIVDPSQTRNIIERVTELESGLAVESIDREEADTAISGAVDTEIARAISAETELSERIDAIESGASEALDAEIERAISAETALQDAIDDEEARAIAIENAIRQDLTDESELRSSADTAMWTAINDETTRATSAETSIENKVDVETLRAIGVENAISGDLQTYKATNNAALQAETTRATSAETALQTAINDEATARANADSALGTRIDNISSASTAAIEAEAARAQEAESGLTNAINNEVTRATSAETIIANSLNAEINRASSAETALNNQIDAEVLRATAAEAELEAKIGVVSGVTELINAETLRATTAENALSGAIDSISAATSGSVEELDAKIDQEITDRTADVDAEETRAKGVENALSGAIDTLDVRFFDDAKYEDSGNTKVINFYNGNVVKATIDCTDFLVDGMIDDVRIETISGVTYLVIDFNTASGKEDIHIPLSDIFNPNAYYTKDETSGATEIANALALKLNISDFNVYSAATDTLINSKAAQSTVDALSGTVNGHISDSTIHLTTGDVQSQIDNSISGKANSSDVYLKTETSGATEISTALAQKLGISDFNTYSGTVATALGDKQDTLVSSVNIKTINNESILGAGNIDIQGGGKAIEAGRGISITTGETADTVSCTLPITVGSSNTSLSLGSNNLYSSNRTLVIGSNNSVANNVSNSLVVGTNNIIAYGCSCSIAFGYEAKASNSYCFSIGSFTKTSNNFETVFGRYNVSNKANTTWGDSGSTLFSVGNGTADNLRHNAFEIRQNGDIYITKDGQDVKLQDQLGGGGGGITSGEVQTMITSATTPIYQTIEDNEEVTAQALNVLNGELANKLDVSAYTPVDLSNYYTKSQTSGATELSTAFAATQPKLSAGTGISIVDNVISATGGGSITIDPSLDSGSTNPVANSAITTALDNKANLSDVVLYNYGNSSTYNTAFVGSKTAYRIVVNLVDSLVWYFEVFDGSTFVNYGVNSSGNFFDGSGNQIDTPNCINTDLTNYSSGTFDICFNADNVYADYFPNTKEFTFTIYESISIKPLKTQVIENTTALATKQTTLTAGTGIDITSNVISVTGGTGGGISSAECQTMIDESISGKTNQSDFTGHTADTTIHVTAQDKTNWNNKSNFSGDYNDLTNKPTIPTVPTNVSDFTNDAGYITSNDISGKTNQSDFTAHTANTTVHVTSAEKAAWNAKSDFSGSYNDLTDKPTIPTVPTSNTAFTNDAGYITANDITGKTDVTAFTAHTGDTTIHVTSSDKTSWNGAATNASNAVTALGGLSLVKLTQAQYNALATKDNNTLYVIVG